MTILDMRFRVSGKVVPADHGYSLYCAITKAIPSLHAPDAAVAEGEAEVLPGSAPLWKGFGIHPVRGRLIGERSLALTEFSRLTLRVPQEHIATMLPLAGKEINLDGQPLTIGVPELHALQPATSLFSRLVTVKGFMEPKGFREAIQRQLDILGIKGRLEIPLRSGVTALEGNPKRSEESQSPVRRTLRVRDRQVVGYAVVVTELTAEESIRLQESGLGGRRRFGCGIFVPTPLE